MEFPIKQIAINPSNTYKCNGITNPFTIVQSVHNFLHKHLPWNALSTKRAVSILDVVYTNKQATKHVSAHHQQRVGLPPLPLWNTETVPMKLLNS